MDLERYSVFGAEADSWVDGDVGGGVRGGGEEPVAGDSGEGEGAFHPGEAFADALARASSEGVVGEARAGGVLAFGREALGVEAEWVWPEARVAVDDELGSEQDCSFGDVEAGDLVGDFAGAGGDPDGWVEAHGLGEDGVGVGEARVVVGGGRAGAEDGGSLQVEALLYVGMLGDEPEGEAEGVGGGFVASEHDGEALVMYLLVGHAAAVALGVGGVEEHGEQVATISGGGAALADHGVDEGVELGLA